MNIAQILKEQYTSKTGAIRFKLLPISYYEHIMHATQDYKSKHCNHMKIRMWMLVNEKTVPKCLKCGESFYPTTTEQFRHKQYCSSNCANQSDESKQKKIITNLKNWGHKNPSQSETIKTQKKKNNIAKYGVASFSQTQEFKNKFKNTMNKRYGVDYAMQSDELKNRYMNAFTNKKTFQRKMKLNDDQVDILFYSSNFKNFIKNKTIHIASKELSVDANTIRKYMHIHDVTEYISNVSSLEVEMAEFLTSINVKFTQNDRIKIRPYELDFFLPDYNIAIEMNGVYWHSTAKTHDKNYHYNKWKRCQENNIQLLTIFEDQWNFSKDKIQNLIKSHCFQKATVVGARKCQVAYIIAKDARLFVDKYHIQNFVAGTHFGAFYNNELVAVMTFGYTRGTKRSRRFELKRFVALPHTSYPGLFSKMFKYAQKEMQFTEVVSFSDNCWFTGNLYQKSGFSNTKSLPIGYKYLFKNELVHCSRFTKDNIKKKFPRMANKINAGMTEQEAMCELKIPRVYDCGKKEWIWNK